MKEQIKTNGTRGLVIVLSLVMLFAFIPFLGGHSYAAETVIDVSSATSGTDYTYSTDIYGGIFTINTAGSYRLTGSTYSDRVVVADGITVDLSLDNVLISRPGINLTQAALDIGMSNTTVVLVGNNRLVGTLAVPEYGTLTINGQGSLYVTSLNNSAGIGMIGNTAIEKIAGEINIEGGNITSQGLGAGAGIGGGINGSSSVVNISGGKVYAKSNGQGAGIGTGRPTSNLYVFAGIINISGGEVEAVGGSQAAGIGAQQERAIGEINISGGKVSASGVASCPAIGGFVSGYSSNRGFAGKISITGGTVYAHTANNNNAPDIGTGTSNYVWSQGPNEVIIDGGSVNASKVSPTPKNSNSDFINMNTLTVGAIAVPDANITDLSIDTLRGKTNPNPASGIYGSKGIMTDASGKLYLWLKETRGVEKPLWVLANGKPYALIFARSNDNLGAATLLKPIVTAQAIGLDNLEVGKPVSGAKIKFSLFEAEFNDDISLAHISATGLPPGLHFGQQSTTRLATFASPGLVKSSATSIEVDVFGTPTTANQNEQLLGFSFAEQAFYGGIAELTADDGSGFSGAKLPPVATNNKGKDNGGDVKNTQSLSVNESKNANSLANKGVNTGDVDLNILWLTLILAAGLATAMLMRKRIKSDNN